MKTEALSSYLGEALCNHSCATRYYCRAAIAERAAARRRDAPLIKAMLVGGGAGNHEGSGADVQGCSARRTRALAFIVRAVAKYDPAFRAYTSHDACSSSGSAAGAVCSNTQSQWDLSSSLHHAIRVLHEKDLTLLVNILPGDSRCVALTELVELVECRAFDMGLKCTVSTCDWRS